MGKDDTISQLSQMVLTRLQGEKIPRRVNIFSAIRLNSHNLTAVAGQRLPPANGALRKDMERCLVRVNLKTRHRFLAVCPIEGDNPLAQLLVMIRPFAKLISMLSYR